jgi:hypothetical protein
MQNEVCNTGQSYNVKLTNECFENVTKVKYCGTTIHVHNEISSKLNSENTFSR